MNSYRFQDLNLGLKEQFSVSIHEQMLENFRQITGDDNPLHNDKEFAMSKGHSGKVVFGMLTASFLSTLAGVYLPGKNSLIHSVEVKFAKPVYVNDTLSIQGTVTELNELFSIFTMKVEIFNQRNEKVLRGVMKVGVLDE